MGSWRLWWVMMANRIMLFPERAMAYRQQKGMEIQAWADSRPGMLVNKKVGNVDVRLLKIPMFCRSVAFVLTVLSSYGNKKLHGYTKYLGKFSLG